MKVSVPHQTTQLEAITKVKKILNDSRSQMAAHLTDVTEDWQGHILHFAFTAQKQHISGTLEVKDHSFELYAKLPLMMRLFEGKIEKMIQDESKKMLEVR
ncbi:MAG: polyhydroxyalkanoic acid system family protein [Nitrososphaera sp.]|nr:polyhydroxyalkanoic acid system family protein [Nitrososphaera sp.]